MAWHDIGQSVVEVLSIQCGAATVVCRREHFALRRALARLSTLLSPPMLHGTLGLSARVQL